MSFLAWIDFDQADRDRTRRIMDLFDAEDSRDELGLGAIRDAISDLLFPGTSTIQTRLRYMLFVPWIYCMAAGRPGPVEARQRYARALEIRLISALENSPFGNTLLLEIAKQAIVAEGLGQDDVPDLLSVSFSSNDLVGHTWGPDSHEVLDTTLRTDELIAELMQYLDTVVGRDRYALVLTADHGVCPLPEVAVQDVEGARRIPAKTEFAALEKHLATRFPDTSTVPISNSKPETGTGPVKVPRWLEATPLPHIYINERLAKRAGTTRAAVAKVAAEWLANRPGIAMTATREQILEVPLEADPDSTLTKMRKCYHPDRGGDLMIFPEPYCLFDTNTTGTTHGTPWTYDTHVPLFVYGPGVAPGRRDEPSRPQQAAAILAEFLNVPPPRDNEYNVPVTLWEE